MSASVALVSVLTFMSHRLLLGLLNGSCEVWCLIDGNKLDRFRGHDAAIAACCWSADDRLLVTASDDQVALLRCVNDSSRVRVYRGHSAPVLCCSTNNVSSLLVTGSYDETVRLWDVASAKCLAIIPAHSDAVTCVRFSHDSSVIVSMSSDGYCRLWDVSTCTCLWTLSEFTSNFIQTTHASTDSSLLRLADSFICNGTDDCPLDRFYQTTHMRNIMCLKMTARICEDNTVILGSWHGKGVALVICRSGEFVTSLDLNEHKYSKTCNRVQGSPQFADCADNGSVLVVCDCTSYHVFKSRRDMV